MNDSKMLNKISRKDALYGARMDYAGEKMSQEYVIQTKNLTKQFRKHKAVDNVCINVEKGSIYGLIGKNGAGKTTLMKMVTGLSRKTSGEIFLFGEHGIAINNMYRRMGTLIENPGIYTNMSAFQNLKTKAVGMGLHNYDDKIREILDLVSLGDTKKKKSGKFSLGMKQRLGIALALIGEPDILVLDEPINGLDPQGIAEIRETIMKLNRERGITILISSHILEELSKVVTHYGIIDNGQIIEEVSKEQLMDKCQERLIIRTDNPDRACPVIEKAGIHNYKVMDNSTIYLFEQLNRSAEINKELVTANVPVNEIYINNQSLENYFIQITGGDK